MTQITYDQAAEQGFTSYAGPYKEGEQWMMLRALEDIYDNGRDFPALVKTSQGVDIYIKPNAYPHLSPYVRTDD